MAGESSKKRRGSASPTRSGAAKRAKRPPEGAHFSKERHATPLPTGEDWVFRVKVISSATDLDNDVFKKAVQGLVKICFPQGVLDELGVDVLRAHMQEEKAPKANMTKMTKVFHAEMIHRLGYMLAEYLDTPAKLESAVESVIAASAALHRKTRWNDMLRRVALSPSQNTANYDGTIANAQEHLPNEEPERLPRRSQKKRQVNKDLRQAQDHSAADNGSDMDVDIPPPVQHLNDKEKKVSSSWRWDVDAHNLSSSDVASTFRRTSDLFAFHALLIARGQLDANAKRKVVRHRIQSMLNDMPEAEYQKWVESLQKLHDGDNTMLVRAEPVPIANSRRVAAATPAPPNPQRDASGVVTNRFHSGVRSATQTEAISEPVLAGSRIKRETNTSSSAASQALQNKDEVGVATTAFRRLSTEECLVGIEMDQDAGVMHNIHFNRTNNGRQSVNGKDCSYSRSMPEHFETPIVDLLWGLAVLDAKTKSEAVECIMGRINERASVPFIGIPKFSGITVVETKEELRKKLMEAVRSKISLQIRIRLEISIRPWVSALPASFPELLSQAFIFASMLPNLTSVLHTLCDANTPMGRNEYQKAQALIYVSLRKRGLSPDVCCGPGKKTLAAQIDRTMRNRTHSDVTKLATIENALRYLAFENRRHFLDLKSSPLIKAWECQTGLQW